MRSIFWLAAPLAAQMLSVAAMAAGADLLVTADFANDGGVASSWSFSDPRLHCQNSAGCRKVIDTIRLPRGYYACRVELQKWPWLRAEGQAHVIVNVARDRGGFEVYADPYDAQGPMRLEAVLTLRPKGSSSFDCMKAGPAFDCQRYGCLAAQPGGTTWSK
jgi:hypothetical protein